MTRLDEHRLRLEGQLSSLRATHASYATPSYATPSYAAPPTVAAALPTAAAAGGLLTAVSGGLFADPAQPSHYLPAPYEGRATSSQPATAVGEGASLATDVASIKEVAYRGVTAPEVSTAVVDSLAGAATPAVAAQAAPLAAELSSAPLTTAPTTAPSTTASVSTSAEPSSPDAAALPQSAVAEAVATPAAVSNPCAGKRCPPQYDMVDRGDHCTCRPASAPPQSRDV